MHTVIIIDDHPLIRAGLKYSIEQSGLFRVVAEAATGDVVLSLVEKHRPELLLLDLGLPLMQVEGLVFPEMEKGGFPLSKETILSSYGGAIVLATLRSRYPDLRIVIVTQHEDTDIITSVIRAGANGFLLKTDMVGPLLNVLSRVMHGETAQSDRVQELLAHAERKSSVEITDREKEVLELIANGFREREIADRLDISLRTVAFHKANLKEKIGAETLAELVAYYHSRVRF
jgi:two-component system secretion response regulator SsrB